jgi:hypothetical protein
MVRTCTHRDVPAHIRLYSHKLNYEYVMNVHIGIDKYIRVHTRTVRFVRVQKKM